MSTDGEVSRVVIVEPQTLIRHALVALLEAAGFVTATDTGASDDLLATVSLHAPNVVLLNVDPAPGARISILHQLPALAERWRTVVLTVDDDPAMHASAIELGAMGIVTTHQPGEILIKAIRKVMAGELWLDQTGMAEVVNRLARRRNGKEEHPERSIVESLTRREHEIVELVAEGLKNRQIAARLSISEATVRNHLTSVLDKLDLDDRFELAVFAFRQGLVACPQTAAMLRMRARWRK